MKLLQANIKNFMSIGDISIDLNRPGLNLIVGHNLDSKSYNSNGAAKSALFEAIAWCLYGEILRDQVTLDGLVRAGCSTMSVSVVLDPEDGTDFVTISRNRKSKKTEVSVVTASGTALFPADSSKDIQKYIDTFLGLDYNTFVNSVYFGRGLTKFFMSASDTERKELLENILQIVSFEDALNRTKFRIKKHEESVASATLKKEKLKGMLEEKARMHEFFKKEQREFLAIYSDTRMALNEKLENERTTLKLTDITFQALSLDLDNIQKKYATSVSLVENAFKQKLSIKLADHSKKELNALYELDEKRTVIINNYSIKKKEYENDLVELNKSIENILKRVGQLDDIHKPLLEQLKQLSSIKVRLELLEPNTPCVHCQSIITDKHREETIKDLINQIENKATEMARINKEILNEELRVSGLKDRWTATQNALKTIIKEEEHTLNMLATDRSNIIKIMSTGKFEIEKDHLKEQAEELKKLAESNYSNMLEVQKTIEQLSSKITNLKKTVIPQLENELHNLDNKQRRLQVNVTDSEVNIDILSQQISDIDLVTDAANNDIAKLNFWLDAFGPKGIKSFIFESWLPFLSERANFYSTYLTGGTVKIEILPTTKAKTAKTVSDKLNVSVINSLGSPTYFGNSYGERKRVDICILFAIQDLVSSRSTKFWNTLILDEVLDDSLDETGIAAMVDLFKNTTDNKSIFIISHASNIKQYFDQYIVIEKENGVSRLNATTN